MLLICGFLGFFQAVLIPGLILNYQNYKKFHLCYFFATSFVISLIVNYCFVMICTAIHIYTRHTLFLFILVELIYLIFSLRKYRKVDAIRKNDNFMLPIDKANSPLYHIFHSILILIISIAFIFSSKYIGDVFTSWDAVVSWNRWAVDFANNLLPRQTWNYPQLIPAINSLPYVLMGNNDIQFFSVLISLSYFPFALCAIYPIFRFCFILAPIFISFGITIFSIQQGVGYADVPVLSLVSISLCCLFMWVNAQKEEKYEHIIFAIIAAGGAAVTKQAGLFWILVLFFIVYEINSSLDHERSIPTKDICKIFCLILVLVLPWYLYTRYQIYLGKNGSEINYVIETIHKGKSYLERIISAIKNYPIYFIYATAAIPCIFIRGYRFLAISGILYVFLWASLLSYDSRNVSIGIPICLFSFGLAIEKVFFPYCNQRLSRLIRPKCNIHTLYIFISSMCIILLFIFLNISKYGVYLDNKLIVRQQMKLMNIGNREINELVVKYVRQYPHKIISSYQFIPYLPGVNKELYHLFHFAYETDRNSVSKFKSLLSGVDRCYILLGRSIAHQYISDDIIKNTILLADNVGDMSFFFYDKNGSLDIVHK